MRIARRASRASGSAKTRRRSGSNDNVTKLREVLQARFENLVFEEKIQK